MPRNKGGSIWEAMKAGKFWHEPEPKPAPDPGPTKKGRKSVITKRTTLEKTSEFLSADSTKRTIISPKEEKVEKPGQTITTSGIFKEIRSVHFIGHGEKKVDIPFNHPGRKSQTALDTRGRRKAKPAGKVKDIDLWDGDTTKILPKITVMPHGLRLIGTYEEFETLAIKLLQR